MTGSDGSSAWLFPPESVTWRVGREAALLFELIHDIQRRDLSTAVVISRDARAGFGVADHVMVLQRGRVVEQGSSERIRGSRKGSTLRFVLGTAAGPSPGRP